MDLWFSEFYTKNVKLSIKIKNQLISHKSEFQQIDIFDSFEFGRILVLDGYIMVTEKDEFIYHEMITHTPMSASDDKKNKRILVIGAGDGGTVRELIKYDKEKIENIDVVEIDKAVVSLSKEYLPFTACGFSDERVNVYYEDGLKFIRSKSNEYDLIIVDSTDPFGPGEGLFTKEFYGNCYKALSENGILVNQHESPFYKNDMAAMRTTHQKISAVFPISYVYQAHIPTYPSGHWLFGFASKGVNPLENIEKWNDLNIKTKYYNTDLHRGAFCLPTYVKEALKDTNE